MDRLAIQIALNNIVEKKEFYPLRPYEEYHKIADKIAPQMAKAFKEAVSKVSTSLALLEIENALSGNDKDKAIAAALATMDWEGIFNTFYSIMSPSYSLVVQETNKLTQQILNKEFGMNLSFNVSNPYSKNIIEDDVGTLIRDVTQQAKDQVKNIIGDAFEYGGHPYETATQIREFIGLTDRQRAMVNNRFQTLVDQGMDIDEAYASGASYTEDLLQRRAETIARTETIRAANGGQQAAWDRASEDGLLDGMMKKWIITPDDRLCPYCLAIADKPPIELDELFTDGDVEVLTPPLHPNCRCAMGLVRAKE